MSGTLIFADVTQEDLFDSLALKARRACVPGSHATIPIRETFWRATTPPSHCTDDRLKHTLILSMKEVYICPSALLQIYRPTEVLSRNISW